MSIHVALNHVTHYRYDRAVCLSAQQVRLRPAPHCRTRILSYSLRVEPAKHFVNWQQDPQGNYLARLVFPERTRVLRVEVDLIAEMAVLNPFDFFLAPYAEYVPLRYEPAEAIELAPYLVQAPLSPLFAAYLAHVPRAKTRTIDYLVELNRRLASDIRYLIRMEPGVQTPEETLQRAAGSCRDSSWLLVQVLRHLGLAARFVSGYLIQLASDLKSLDGPPGPTADFTDLHAWCEVYLPGAGWIGLDPTSGLLAGEGHIPLACTPEPSSAAPISGAVDDSEVEFEHHMSIARVWEAPRVTKPYTDTQWREIERLGETIDAELVQGDVRLTMGGEPTFVALDDPDGAEWNTAALGPDKRRLAADLFHRLRAHYAPQGLSHFGQGRWYPGEPLPRWSLNCFWRRDGEPIWTAPQLIAEEGRDGGATAEIAQRFLAGVAERLGVHPRHVFPAFEDVVYYLWRERRLPINVDPFDSKLEDPQERARLARLFAQGLERVAGHVLPLARDAGGQHWRSGPWFLRAERCYLVPGDSSLGFRLPLDSQPWVAYTDYPHTFAPDPMAGAPPLALHAQFRLQRRDGGAAAAPRPGAQPQLWRQSSPERRPAAQQSAHWIARTALCAEPRQGVLYLFMPPTPRLEDYLELVGAIEATAEALRQPILFEGYEPPQDARLNSLRVTPDPGVIEVNIHPSHGWRELTERTEFLYEAARASRLGTEKFMLDGRHTGTGGGNHFVLGGATPADSPFLRRPDLLGSLIAYWHNHPSLSYLFTGLFIGPTSQAPRVDEARNDSLYELELALRQMPQPLAGTPLEQVPPWLTDRLLRNLLIDVSGNTHRAEFCIDKLYSPDGPNGRLGLLELRAFEMPPHARMSLTQQLLLRSLIARFWKQPYRPARLARWGTELHDRFMLPYFVEQDFRDVLSEQRAAGYALDADWFAPHFEFRFPKYGDTSIFGTRLTLRQALEPWHVMGEEGATGGAVRYVDSSVERLQVHVTGLPPDRFALTCNGRSVPLRPTGTVGEFVAGVRYRAWQPPSALHPKIGVHSPLTFDLFDTWMHRSLGGCQYHVAHPGGRSYQSFPVNSFEAESRRLARFFRLGHTPARAAARAVGPAEPAGACPEFPFTLDLRR
ncbi:MAG TPA: transglutaminase family protein [Steroidobacteraceae bacterium]|nr:transglutaminase family protein [Steroidobacteraceae bacterium]